MKRMIALLLCVVCVAALFGGCGKKTNAVTVEIRCDTVWNNLDLLSDDKLDLIPQDGLLLKATVEVTQEQTAMDALKVALKENGQELVLSEEYGYIQGLCGLSEYDCGPQSGWMFCVNDEFLQESCDTYIPQDGDVVQYLYTCNWGVDLGMEY